MVNTEEHSITVFAGTSWLSGTRGTRCEAPPTMMNTVVHPVSFTCNNWSLSMLHTVNYKSQKQCSVSSSSQAQFPIPSRLTYRDVTPVHRHAVWPAKQQNGSHDEGRREDWAVCGRRRAAVLIAVWCVCVCVCACVCTCVCVYVCTCVYVYVLCYVHARKGEVEGGTCRHDSKSTSRSTYIMEYNEAVSADRKEHSWNMEVRLCIPHPYPRTPHTHTHTHSHTLAHTYTLTSVHMLCFPDMHTHNIPTHNTHTKYSHWKMMESHNPLSPHSHTKWFKIFSHRLEGGDGITHQTWVLLEVTVLCGEERAKCMPGLDGYTNAHL